MSDETGELNKKEIKELKSKIGQLVPQRASFELGDKIYHLRPVTINDWAWIQDEFKESPIMLAGDLDFRKFIKIIYRILEEKGEFLAEEMEIIDDNGYKIKKDVTGPEKFGTAMLGFDGLNKVSDAYQKALGMSNMDPDEIIEMAEKKIPGILNRQARRKKGRTGRESTTSSRANTGSPPDSSGT